MISAVAGEGARATQRFGYLRSGVARFLSGRCLAPGDESGALETRPRM